jgi:uncharacterized protein (UPF0210 family)
VTPLALVPSGPAANVAPPRSAERAAAALGRTTWGLHALVEKGITPGDRALIDSNPRALADLRVCSSINGATTRAGSTPRVAEMGGW